MIATLTDEEVYEKFLNGNTELMDIIYNRYRNDLVNFSRFIVKNLETAEEIVQDIFIQILSNPKSYNKEYTVRSFLFLLCYRKSITYNTKLSRRRRIENEFLSISDSASVEDVSDTVINYEEKEIVNKALQLLKLEYRLVLELTEFQGFSTREASIILNRTEGATKTLKCRAKESLKKIIDNDLNTEKKIYRRATLKAIILVFCIGVLSISSVYAVTKVIRTVFKNIQYFNMNEIDENVDYKDTYITENEARDKIREYLKVLSYDLNESISLFKDVIKPDAVYWRYSDENVEIRIDATTGEFSKVYIKNENSLNDKRNMKISKEYIINIAKGLGINLENKKVYQPEMNLELQSTKREYQDIVFYDNREFIVFKYKVENNFLLCINIKNKKIDENEIKVSYTEAIEILSNNYNVKEILEYNLKDVEINYLVCAEVDLKKGKIVDSDEYRIAWNIIFVNYENKKISVYIDCETGEVIESKGKI